MANEAYRPVWNAVDYAVRTGALVPRPCEVCGATGKTDAHHDDYSKPLEVRWLCRSHHSQQHGQRGRKRNDEFCVNGHPRTPELTYTTTRRDQRGERVIRSCVICRRAAEARHRERKR